MTSCPELTVLSDAAAHRLPSDQAAEIEAHAASCASCQARIVALRSPDAPPAGSDAVEPPQPALRQAQPERVAKVSEILPRGTPLGRYLVLECLGAGVFGVVYSAYDPSLDRRVAIKVLRPEIAERSEEGTSRLLREAQAVARVSHPNVVTIHDVGTAGERIFLAMDLVPGGSLASWLKAPHRTRHEILAAFVDAGRGLAAAHAAGLVHRDFKPGNVLLRVGGHAQVADFGVVRPAAQQRPSLDLPIDALADALLGTPAYMAPEQLAGDHVDARADQFSFCVGLYEALCGRRPFPDAQTLGQHLEAVRRGPLPPPDGALLSRRMARALLRGLEAEPSRRFPSMDGLLRELSGPILLRRALLVGGPILACALVVGAVAGASALASSRQRRECDAAAAEIAPAWDDAKREAARKAFEATGTPYQKDAWTRADAVLSSYANAWRAERRGTCLAGSRSGAAPATVARQACLARRLAAFQALSNVFARADASAASKAVEAAYALEPVDRCAGNAPPGMEDSLPADPAARPEAERIRKAIAEADALDRAGKLAEGLPLASQALEDARKLGFPPLVAEALLEVSTLEAALGTPGAEARLEEAGHAGLSSGHDEVAFEAWNDLAMLSAERKDPDAAARLARMAEATFQRTGRGEHLRARFLLGQSAALRAQSKLREALELDLQALEIYRRVLPAGDPRMATVLDEVGALYADVGDYPSAIRYDEAAVTAHEQANGPEHPDLATSLTNLCAAFRASGKFAEAEAACRRALAIREHVFGAGHPDVAGTLSVLGAVSSSQGRQDEALALYGRALEIHEKAFGHQHPNVAVQLDNIGVLLRRSGRLGESRARMLDAEGICGAIPERCGSTAGHVEANLGDLLLQQGKRRDAEAKYKRAQDLLTATVGPDHPDLSAPLSGLGRVRLASRNFKAALPLLERALALAERSPGQPRYQEIRFSLGRALFEGRSDPPRGLELIRAAAADLSASHADKAILAEAQRWLAAHDRGPLRARAPR